MYTVQIAKLIKYRLIEHAHFWQLLFVISSQQEQETDKGEERSYEEDVSQRKSRTCHTINL